MTLVGGEGTRQSVTHTFFAFENRVFNAFGRKIFITNQDKASKDTFLQLHLIFQRNLSLKISHTGGRGVRKVPKKCHVLFEWPFITIYNFYHNFHNKQQTKIIFLY